MRTLYLDCSMGAAGDMLTAALLELFPDPDAMLEELNAIGVPHVVYRKTAAQKCGIGGTHISVSVDGVTEDEHLHDHADHHRHDDHHHDEHPHAHSSLAEIESIVRALRVPEPVQEDVIRVYRLIAEAESRVHQCPVEEIHFHEVGTLDAIADVTAICLLLHRLAPEQVLASPVHVGSGTVRCAHGILPVPAPATAYLLQGIPTYGGAIDGELCTPTGAALLKHFVQSFGTMPVMRVAKIGYGMGTKDFPRANCVRAMLGETDGGDVDRMVLLSANLDDMTAEQIAFASEQLFAAGAVDVFTVPIGMKKSRPGTLLCAICAPQLRETVAASFFRHTTTLGVRESETHRYVLRRRTEERNTPLGTVRVKVADGYGVTREKIEYEDLARIARENGLSLTEAKAAAEREH